MVRIITGAAVNARTVTLPSDAELRQLLRIVFAKYPRLDPSTDRDYSATAFEADFRNAFFAIGHMGRLPAVQLSGARSLGWWSEYASNILRDFDLKDWEVNGRTFAIGCLAWGDIPHSVGPRFPFDFSVGLTFQHAGRQSSPDSWRAVLATAKLRPCSELPVYGEHRPGIVRLDVATDSIGLISSTMR